MCIACPKTRRTELMVSKKVPKLSYAARRFDLDPVSHLVQQELNVGFSAAGVGKTCRCFHEIGPGE